MASSYACWCAFDRMSVLSDPVVSISSSCWCRACTHKCTRAPNRKLCSSHCQHSQHCLQMEPRITPNEHSYTRCTWNRSGQRTLHRQKDHMTQHKYVQGREAHLWHRAHQEVNRQWQHSTIHRFNQYCNFTNMFTFYVINPYTHHLCIILNLTKFGTNNLISILYVCIVL